MTFSDSRVSKFLQENFIVQWEAVSPVRLVKFDLGEGRSFSGTVNGEIALYFCDSNGKVFDILPALQSPAVTLMRIKEAHTFFTKHASVVDLDAYVEDIIHSPYPPSQINKEQIQSDINQAKHNAHKGQYTATVGGIHSTSLRKLHRDRLKKVAKERYDQLTENKMDVIKDINQIPAGLLFPDTKKGEEKRDAYIHAAVDEATRDMRTMTLSKVGPPPSYFNRTTFTSESLTVVEPGGLGYYQWQIDRAFFGAFDAKDNSDYLFTLIPTFPQDWKEIVFTTIMKQELKGGIIEYNSESLDAIQVIE